MTAQRTAVLREAREEAATPAELRVWFTTKQAAAYLSTTPAAIRMAIARGRIVPDSFGGQGRAKCHMFKRATLDAYYAK